MVTPGAGLQSGTVLRRSESNGSPRRSAGNDSGTGFFRTLESIAAEEETATRSRRASGAEVGARTVYTTLDALSASLRTEDPSSRDAQAAAYTFLTTSMRDSRPGTVTRDGVASAGAKPATVTRDGAAAAASLTASTGSVRGPVGDDDSVLELGRSQAVRGLDEAEAEALTFEILEIDREGDKMVIRVATHTLTFEGDELKTTTVVDGGVVTTSEAKKATGETWAEFFWRIGANLFGSSAPPPAAASAATADAAVVDTAAVIARSEAPSGMALALVRGAHHTGGFTAATGAMMVAGVAAGVMMPAAATVAAAGAAHLLTTLGVQQTAAAVLAQALGFAVRGAGQFVAGAITAGAGDEVAGMPGGMMATAGTAVLGFLCGGRGIASAAAGAMVGLGGGVQMVGAHADPAFVAGLIAGPAPSQPSSAPIAIMPLPLPVAAGVMGDMPGMGAMPLPAPTFVPGMPGGGEIPEAPAAAPVVEDTFLGGARRALVGAAFNAAAWAGGVGREVVRVGQDAGRDAAVEVVDAAAGAGVVSPEVADDVHAAAAVVQEEVNETRDAQDAARAERAEQIAQHVRDRSPPREPRKNFFARFLPRNTVGKVVFFALLGIGALCFVAFGLHFVPALATLPVFSLLFANPIAFTVFLAVGGAALTGAAVFAVRNYFSDYVRDHYGRFGEVVADGAVDAAAIYYGPRWLQGWTVARRILGLM